MKRMRAVAALLLAIGGQGAAAATVSKIESFSRASTDALPRASLTGALPRASIVGALPRAGRIMSLKLCTDELLMDLVPEKRIVSLSYLSQEDAALKLWPQAARLPVNHNTPEEVLAARPDLVLTDRYTTPAMRRALALSGARVVEVPEAENFAQIRAVTRMVAAAVGEPNRAEEMLAKMDATLGELAAERPARPARVAGWGEGGFVPGSSGLFNAVLAAAGGQPIAGGYYDVESLIAARPDVLAFGDAYLDAPSLRADQDNHPALGALFANRRVVYPSALLACGLPESADAAAALHDALEGAMRAPGGIP